MKSFWLTFTDGSEACCEGQNEYDAKIIAEKFTGKTVAGGFQAEGTKKAAQNNHPTVKPTALMRYLVRLVTPPGGVVLDPFMGSGSTGRGAVLDGFRFIGIERAAHYVEIARARIAAVGGAVSIDEQPSAAAPSEGVQGALFA